MHKRNWQFFFAVCSIQQIVQSRIRLPTVFMVINCRMRINLHWEFLERSNSKLIRKKLKQPHVEMISLARKQEIDRGLLQSSVTFLHVTNNPPTYIVDHRSSLVAFFERDTHRHKMESISCSQQVASVLSPPYFLWFFFSLWMKQFLRPSPPCSSQFRNRSSHLDFTLGQTSNWTSSTISVEDIITWICSLTILTTNEIESEIEKSNVSINFVADTVPLGYQRSKLCNISTWRCSFPPHSSDSFIQMNKFCVNQCGTFRFKRVSTSKGW